MTGGLETFAKVRALHDRTTNPGEKAAAAARMTALARGAGLTVEEAVHSLDRPAPKSAGQVMAESFAEFMSQPEFVAERKAREERRRAEAAEILRRHGSEEALFADTPMEAALRAACEPLLGPGETWCSIYRLHGWGSLSPDRDMPATVRTAVAEAWPMPTTVTEAWVEYEATEALTRERYTVSAYHEPEVFTQARKSIVAALLDTLPARSLNDVRARLSWLEFWPSIEVEQNAPSYRATLSALRADIERMGRRMRERGATE